MERRTAFDVDLQAAPPDVRIGLSRVGVTGVEKAIRMRYGDVDAVVAAQIDCSVDLDPSQKGVHMSRFPELFEEAIDEIVMGEKLYVENLAAHVAREIRERQRALRAEVRITARYPIERRTPVTGLRTQELVTLIGLAIACEDVTRRAIGVESTGITACPCAQGLVRESARDRLAEAGFGETEIEKVFALVPLATHNQRGRGTLVLGTERTIRGEELVDVVERSMSSPIFELLKRPDELFVVEHAHLQPRFVEDVVRAMIGEVLARYGTVLDESDFVQARQVNFETIHNHDVLAERAGTVGELRRELETGEQGTRFRELRDWLQSGA